MTVTASALKILDDEVTCVVGAVESGVGYMYLGTTRGEVKKYNQATGVVTTLKKFQGKVLSMALYSGILWIGLSGSNTEGNFASLTTY